MIDRLSAVSEPEKFILKAKFQRTRAADMTLEDKSRRRQAERHRRSQKSRSKKLRNIIEAREQEAQEQAKPVIDPEEESELIRVRVRKTSEAAELLSKALGAEGVELLLKAFSEQERPRDLLSALRRRLQVAMAVKNGT